MSNMKYNAVVSITEKPINDLDGKPLKNQQLLDLSKIPIRSFSVVGGASRSINLDSADEISIGNEFEQARTYKNITLFVPPDMDFTGVKLTTLKNSASLTSTKFFTLFFQVDIYSGGKRTHTIILETSHAWLKQEPILVGNNLLMLEVRFNHAQLLHGKLNKASREFVHEEI